MATVPKTAWRPGTSGNPKGRPPTAERVRKLLEPKSKELVERAIAQALASRLPTLTLSIKNARHGRCATSFPVLSEITN